MNQNTTNARNATKTLGLRYEPSVFLSESLARKCAATTAKSSMVVMGDAPAYWVVCPADASRLERAGYEIL